MNFNFKLIGSNLAAILFLATVAITPTAYLHADIITSECEEGKICNPIGVNSINEFVKTLLEGMIKIGIPIVALAIIYSGFLFVKAQGNPEEITKAKQALLYSVIGAVLLLGSWAIAQLITETVLQLG